MVALSVVSIRANWHFEQRICVLDRGALWRWAAKTALLPRAEAGMKRREFLIGSAGLTGAPIAAGAVGQHEALPTRQLGPFRWCERGGELQRKKQLSH